MTDTSGGFALITSPGNTLNATCVDTISGGQIVFAPSGAAGENYDVVTSSYATPTGNPIIVQAADAGANWEGVIGVAMNDGTSGSGIGVLTRGVLVMEAGATIEPGRDVYACATNTESYRVDPCTDGQLTSGTNLKIGRSLTGATASAKFLYVLLNI